MRRPLRADASSSTVGQAPERLWPVDPPGRIVRRIDDHDPGAWRDGGGDGVDIEVERREVDAHLDRHETGLDEERFVGKPGRQAEDDLVAGIGDGLHRRRRGRRTRRW